MGWLLSPFCDLGDKRFTNIMLLTLGEGSKVESGGREMVSQ